MRTRGWRRTVGPATASWRAAVVAGGVTAALAACGPAEVAPTVEEAQAFVRAAEGRLLELWIHAERAAWVQQNFITGDTSRMAADASADVMAATTALAAAAARFTAVDLPPDLRRKLQRLRTSLAAVAPSDPVLQQELAGILAGLEAEYGRGEYCDARGAAPCQDLPALERTMATSRDTDELVDAWQGWRRVSPAFRDRYARFVDLANAGAVELGFRDAGDLWRSAYDMPAEAFRAELDRLWAQVRPLYESLHCLVRAELGDHYGTAIVPPGVPIPAHLVGNMWSQSWTNIADLVAPRTGWRGDDLTDRLQRRGVEAPEMVRYGERFFGSLGFAPLPDTFWERSLFVQPVDRDVVCHASAWNLDYEEDVRIKMCIRITDADFVVIHHELGHVYYQRAYRHQDPLYRAGANDGFHEGIGDTIALSITPEYLAEVGLLDRVPPAADDIGRLLRQALDKVAFLPFGLLVDEWRWQVFSGAIPPETYNTRWWELREAYQGIRPPVPRSEADFDPGAKYHVPANVPYARYFLAHILQFQFHRALCEAAGVDGPLHRCSIFGSAAAGARLRDTLELGASRPWPDALEVMTGTREMDATAILDYFEPLRQWLDVQNAGRRCGW